MTGDAKRLLDQIAALAPEIESRSAEIAATRDLPDDIVTALRATGLFRMFTPKTYGGLELDFPTALDVIRLLSRIDSAVGWNAMIGTAGILTFPLLSRETLDAIYKGGPDVISAGSSTPAARAERTQQGWRIGGRWPFASGAKHADWISGFCFMQENGQPIPDSNATDGRPLVMGFSLPASAWEIEDNWHAAGLQGTGSHHIRLQERIVPAAHFLDLFNGKACESGPLYVSPWPMMMLMPAATAIGIAEGARDALIALAKTGRQQLHAKAPMRESELFQHELGEAAAAIRAARLALEAQAKSHWVDACAGTLRNETKIIEGQQIAVHAVTACRRAVEACFALAGGSAVYLDSPLQRRVRDILVLAQHAAVQQRQLAKVGAALLAEPAPAVTTAEKVTRLRA